MAGSAHGTAVAYGRQTVLYGGGVPKPYSQQAAKLLPERVSLSEQFGLVSASQDGAVDESSWGSDRATD